MCLNTLYMCNMHGGDNEVRIRMNEACTCSSSLLADQICMMCPSRECYIHLFFLIELGMFWGGFKVNQLKNSLTDKNLRFVCFSIQYWILQNWRNHLRRMWYCHQANGRKKRRVDGEWMWFFWWKMNGMMQLKLMLRLTRVWVKTITKAEARVTASQVNPIAASETQFLSILTIPSQLWQYIDLYVLARSEPGIKIPTGFPSLED